MVPYDFLSTLRNNYTRLYYANDIRLFEKFVGNIPWDEVTTDHLVDWYRQMPWAASTKRRRVSAVRAFGRFCGYKFGAIKNSRIDPKICWTKNTMRPLTADQVEALKGYGGHPGQFESRDRALVFLLLDTGMTVSEVANLTMDSVEGVREGIVVVAGRTVAVTKYDRDQLLWFLEHRSGMFLEDGPCLFPNYRGKRLSRSGINAIVKVYGAERDVFVNPRILRQTHIRKSLDEGEDWSVIARRVGVSTLARWRYAA